MVFQQNLLKKSYFVAKMSGPAGQFLLLKSALSLSDLESNLTSSDKRDLRNFSGVVGWVVYQACWEYGEPTSIFARK